MTDSRLALITQERPATTEHLSADRTPEIPEPAGQMFMIRKAVLGLLEKGEPLPMLKANPGVAAHPGGNGYAFLKL